MSEKENISLEQLENDTTFFSDLKNENFCLVLGAGFSYGIKNKSAGNANRNIPLSSDFIRLTKDQLKVSAGDFKEAANCWKNNFDSDPGLPDLFRSLFLVDEEVFLRERFELYKNILFPNWYRVYTFNFDNVFETIITQAKKNEEYADLYYPKNKEFPSGPAKKYYAHIHGKITPESDLLSLVFFSREYSAFYENTNNLYHSLENAVNEEDQRKNLIIIGCRFNETIVYKNFFTKITRAGVRIFHFDIERPNIDTEFLEKVDYRFIKCTAEDFLRFIGKNKKKVTPVQDTMQDYKPLVEVRNLYDLDKISKNFSLIENPLTGRFGAKDSIHGWIMGKPFISYNPERLLDLESDFKIFPITGAAGTGKSTLLFQNIDNYIHSGLSDNRQVVFIHPGALINLTNYLDPEEKYLIVIDALDRHNTKESAVSAFEPIFKIVLKNTLDAKFIFSVYSSSWSSIFQAYSMDKRVNFSYIYYELKATEGWEINQVYDKLFAYYGYDKKAPDLDWVKIKGIVLEKANTSPSFIRYIFEDAANEPVLREKYFSQQPKGIYQLIWKDISDIPGSSSTGVITIILLLTYYPLLRLSRDSLNYLLASSKLKDPAITLEFIWNNVLKKGYANNKLRGLDPVFQENINRVIADETLISESYLSEFSKQYRDFYNNEFKQTCNKLVQDTKTLIQAKNFREIKHALKAIELLLIDNSDSMLNFITDCYSTGLKNETGILRSSTELRLLLNHLWNKRIWELQILEISESDNLSNSNKQIAIYILLCELVEKIFKYDPFKLHEYANQLRKFCLPAFDEDSQKYQEIKTSLLQWYNRSNELQLGKDILTYQALAKFYLETNDFEKGLKYINSGLDSIEPSEKKNPKIISLLLTEVDILLSEAEALFILKDKKANHKFDLSKKALKKCQLFITDTFELAKIAEYDFDTKTNIRSFYTFLPQFIDRSFKLKFDSYPKYEDIRDANEKLDYIIRFFPEHKDTLVSNAVFKLRNLNSLYPEYKIAEIVRAISVQLIERYEKRKEPKVIDAIKSLLKVCKTKKINLPNITQLKSISHQKKPTPHIRRNERWVNEKIEREILEGKFASQEDLIKLNKMVLQPFNFSSARNIIRGLMLQCCLWEKKGMPTDIIIARILEIYKKGNMQYKAYVLKTFYSLYNKLFGTMSGRSFDTTFFSFQQLVQLGNKFITIIPVKESMYEMLIPGFQSMFTKILNKKGPGVGKIVLLEDLLNNFKKLDFPVEDLNKLKRHESVIRRLKNIK